MSGVSLEATHASWDWGGGRGGQWGVLPYISCMCIRRCKGYSLQAV